MMHITAALQYNTHVEPGSAGHAANMHLPTAQGVPSNEDFGLTKNQMDDQQSGGEVQLNTIFANWQKLRVIAEADKALDNETVNHIVDRISYASVLPGAFAHYDTVLIDLVFYLATAKLTKSATYKFANTMLAEANKRRKKGTGAVKAM